MASAHTEIRVSVSLDDDSKALLARLARGTEDGSADDEHLTRLERKVAELTAANEALIRTNRDLHTAVNQRLQDPDAKAHARLVELVDGWDRHRAAPWTYGAAANAVRRALSGPEQ